jgi:hypothetical protein
VSRESPDLPGAQSFGVDHKDRVCVYVFIGVSVCASCERYCVISKQVMVVEATVSRGAKSSTARARGVWWRGCARRRWWVGGGGGGGGGWGSGSDRTTAGTAQCLTLIIKCNI